jgi:DNA-binding NarL/FixJ family response regulator
MAAHGTRGDGRRREPDGSGAPDGLRSTRVEVEGREIVVLSHPLPSLAEATPDALEGLSGAEGAVAALLLAGCSYSEIAATRGTSLGTVKKQIQAIYRKLGIGTRSELAARFLG